MKIEIIRNKTEFLTGSILALLVITFTFSINDWSYSVGIDPPIAWVFNHLFDNGLNAGKHIIFPHGPLAFLMYPLPQNALLVTVIVSLLKALMLFNIIKLLSEAKSYLKYSFAFIVSYLFSILSDFNHLLLINIILLYCNSWLFSARHYKIQALILTALAFYVKAYVGIVAGTIFFSFTVYNYFQNRKLKAVLTDGALLLVLIITIWLMMYGTLSGFARYIKGMILLAQDNSSAAAYYPYNNWLLLAGYISLLLVILIINRTKQALFYFCLTGLSLFAAWKHGMAREDISHVEGFFLLTCLPVLFFFFCFTERMFSSTLPCLLPL